MVMEAAPSPQSVGREFVRQYYTLLNKAPTHLHRFYNNYSSFVHGGLDAPNRETPPVIGQKQIHNRIQQLNFRDCHAKISQVDSQATLGNGVVVQVTGELSNGGAPMRRFTQTFVLAAQSPKKYYVHNDIFRYQDVVVSEEEGDETRSEPEEEAYFPPAPAAAPAPFPPAPPAPLHPLPPARSFDLHGLTSHLNGHAPEDSGRQLVAALQGMDVQGGGGTVAPTASYSGAESLRGDTPPPEEPAEPEPEPEREPTPPPPQPALPPPPPEPKTYANLLKSGGGVSQAPVYTTPAPAEPAPRPPRAPRQPRADYAPPQQPADTAGGGSGGGGGGGARRYSDTQQLFLGNLPPSATEDELRAIFGRFGAIAELRLHGAKPGGGPLPGGRYPGYGFITYEEVQSAQNCLTAGDLYFPSDGPDATKLNVEEKKARPRPAAPRAARHAPPFARPAFRR